jgi:hypothetical protein
MLGMLLSRHASPLGQKSMPGLPAGFQHISGSHNSVAIIENIFGQMACSFFK